MYPTLTWWYDDLFRLKTLPFTLPFTYTCQDRQGGWCRLDDYIHTPGLSGYLKTLTSPPLIHRRHKRGLSGMLNSMHRHVWLAPSSCFIIDVSLVIHTLNSCFYHRSHFSIIIIIDHHPSWEIWCDHIIIILIFSLAHLAFLLSPVSISFLDLEQPQNCQSNDDALIIMM